MFQIRLAAYALIDDGAHLLLCRIAPRIAKHAGKWTLPGGGLDLGETPEGAVIREVAEETGLIVEPRELLGTDTLVLGSGAEAWHHLRLIFRAEVVGGELRHEVDGTTDRCRWHPRMSVGELPRVTLVDAALRLAGPA
ncbi:MAG: NUDIX domain-containing protein [Acidobacteriota bacterium]